MFCSNEVTKKMGARISVAMTALLITAGCGSTGDTKITQLEQRIEGLEKQLTSLKGTVSTEETAALKSRVEELRAKLAGLQGEGNGNGNGNGGTDDAAHTATVHASWRRVPLSNSVKIWPLLFISRK